MGLYRKKPIVIEAVRFIDQPTEIEGSEPAWYREARTIDPGDIGSISYSTGHLRVDTLEGRMWASPSDWIIKGVKGELYPIKDAIFRETYEDARVSPASVCTRRTCKLSGEPIP